MALLLDPRAVRAQARFPRCSSVCGCVTPFFLRSAPECCCTKILGISSLTCPVSHTCNRSFNSEFLSVPLGTSAKSRRQW